MSPEPKEPADSIVRCREVTVAYGSDVVLHNVSIDVPQGAFLPFVGPNGAGKTTFLRAILGLIKVRSGTIETPFHRSPPGYVPQQHSIDTLYPVSVRQIVEMGLYPKLGWWRRPSGGDRQTVEAALARFDLLDHQRKTFAELSGGMKQKALVARALASGAEVFIMDEPTSELDEESEIDVLNHLARLAHEEGRTVLLAHHGLDHLIRLTEQLCLVNHGHARLASIAEVLAERASMTGPAVEKRFRASSGELADRATAQP